MNEIDYSTRKLNRLRRRILRVYDQARWEMTDQLSEFLERFEQLDAHKRELLAEGKLTEEQYRTWLRNQVFQSELMQAKLDNITQTCTNAQQTAYKLARDEQYDIFAFGANHTFYELEQAAGVEFNLTLYNTEAVKRLLLENPKLVPNRRIKSESNRTYDARIFNRYVMQGIIQGKTVRAIAERAVQGMADTEVHWAMNNAITALTGAQNAGALQQMRNARKLGIEVQKRWNSTLDYRTREMHRLLDQETTELDEPFEVEGYEIMYPGDPDADPEMVYHCRCKLTSALVKYPRRNAMRRDNTTGEVIPMQTYEEWYEGKKKKFSIDDNEQSFRSTAIDSNQVKEFPTPKCLITAHKIPASRYGIFVSDRFHLKPKAMHQLEQILDDVYGILGNPTENRPTVVVVPYEELNDDSIATYNSVQNAIRIYAGLASADIKAIATLQVDGVCSSDRRSTLLHELIHWQDAQEYQRLYRKITNNADAEAYRDWIKAKSKDILEKLAHKGYNIYEISNYAKKELQKKKPGYDEAYTEYRTKRYLTR